MRMMKMNKEPQMNITWHCPECAYKLGGHLTKDGDCYSCLCSDGYWKMVKGKWEWQKGRRPQKE